MKRIVIASSSLGLGLMITLALAALHPASAQQTSSRTSLSPAQLAGKKLFLQRCSVCHLPPLNVPQDPDPKPYGPLLSGSVRGAEKETRARNIILKGTARMPGFQYGLQSKQLDALMEYLKIL
ncbi:MAG: cytochrome c [Acidobacteriota bacterium]